MDDDWSDEVSTFFERTRGKKGASTFKQGDGGNIVPSNGSIEEEKDSEKINGH